MSLHTRTCTCACTHTHTLKHVLPNKNTTEFTSVKLITYLHEERQYAELQLEGCGSAVVLHNVFHLCTLRNLFQTHTCSIVNIVLLLVLHLYTKLVLAKIRSKGSRPKSTTWDNQKWTMHGMFQSLDLLQLVQIQTGKKCYRLTNNQVENWELCTG